MKNFEVLPDSPLFAGLNEEELSAALERLHARKVSYPRGACLLMQGEPVSTAGFLLSGQARIVREDFWGNRDLIAAVKPGQLFGEVYACSGVPAGVSVLADRDTEVLLLDLRPLLSHEADTCPLSVRLLRSLLTIIVKKSLLLNEKLTHVTRRTTREKLLSYLSQESLRRGSAEFEIPFDRQQLADYLAVDRSAMSAELGRLRDAGFLTFRKNHFVLHHTD